MGCPCEALRTAPPATGTPCVRSGQAVTVCVCVRKIERVGGKRKEEYGIFK